MGLFHFKKFSIGDDRATMKIGTDAVLLGAWAMVSVSGKILDIGSGSGILALMAAQRTNDNVLIDAVEVQKKDVDQARDNIRSSPWSARITVYHSRIQDFFPSMKYDCILCNPPYFSASLLPPDASKQMSKHDTHLTQEELVRHSARLLSAEGKLNIILSWPESQNLVLKAENENLFLRRHTGFFSREGKVQERSLMEFSFTSGSVQEDRLVLYQNGNQKTKAYQKLTGEFYLDR